MVDKLRNQNILNRKLKVFAYIKFVQNIFKNLKKFKTKKQ